MRKVRALSERVDEHLRYLQSVGAHFGTDASFLREQQAEITALRAALDQERRRLAWIADNASRDVFLDEFWGRFDKGVGADGADDLRAKIDALLSGRGEGE